MKPFMSCVVAVLLLVPGLALSEESKQGFWDTLRSKLEQVTPTKKAAVTTAVGGVRGTQNEAGGELYWKGKEQPLSVGEEEFDAFNTALETALAGETDAAIGMFEAFVETYPLSPLRADSLQALENLRVE